MRSGFKISELLSLRVKDVCQHGRMPDYMQVARKQMKRMSESRWVRLHPQAKEALAAWLPTLERNLQGNFGPETPSFYSRLGTG